MKKIYIKFKDWVKSETILENIFIKITISNNIIFLTILAVIVKLFYNALGW